MTYETVRTEYREKVEAKVERLRIALLEETDSVAFVQNQAARTALEGAFLGLSRALDDYEKIVKKALFFAELDGQAQELARQEAARNLGRRPS